MKTGVKKFTSVLLAVVMMLGILTVTPFTVNAAESTGDNAVSANEYTSNGYKYTVYNSEATITGYTGNSTTLNIPSYIGGYKVTKIGYKAFYNNTKITTLTIPNSVKYLDSWAFSDCIKLTTVTIGNSVTDMGTGVFGGCLLLNKATIAYGTTIIGSETFKDCSSLKTVTIPNSVTKIYSSAFENCKSLSNVSIPNSVKEIGQYAFQNCTGITTLSLGNGVTSIGYKAFRNNSKITTLTIPNSVKYLDSWAFSDCVKLTTVTIGNSVTDMGTGVFGGCLLLNKATIAYGTTIIGNETFENCSLLKTVIIPNSVTKIGSSAFENCKSLSSVLIPNSVKEIGQYAFYNCAGITKLSLGNGVMSIGYRAFTNNSKITTLIIPNSVTYLDSYAFADCNKLTTVTIGNSVDEMGTGIFAGCPSLVRVIISNGTSIIGNYMFENCTSLTDIAIPDPFIRIGYVQINDDNLKDSNVFRNCPSKLTIHGKSGSFAQQFAKANGIKFSTSPVSLTVSPTSVSLNKTSLTLEVGKTYTLTKTISPSTATTSYSWSSSNTSVATVNSSGKVTAKKTGTATITVKTSNGKTATCKVTVIKTLPTPKISKLENKAGGIKLSWNKIDGAYGYRLYYKTSSGSWKQFKETTSTSFTDSSVSPGKTKTYTIGCIDKNSKLVSKYDSTGWSKKYTPVAPTVSKLENTSGGVKITWNKIAGVYGYRVYAKTSSGWKKLKDTTATSLTDSAVTVNKAKTYTIRCIDKKGKTISGYNSKGWSKKYTAATPKITKLKNTSKGVSVTWNKVAGVYGYRLYRKYSGSGWKKVKDTTSTSFTDSGAKKGKKVTYTVRCIDKKGNAVSDCNTKGWSITRK